jgi:hypothetical protein
MHRSQRFEILWCIVAVFTLVVYKTNIKHVRAQPTTHRTGVAAGASVSRQLYRRLDGGMYNNH